MTTGEMLIILGTGICSFIMGVCVGWKEFKLKAIKDGKAIYTSDTLGYPKWRWK